MINVKRLDNLGTPYYEVEDVDNYNDLIEWLYRLEETEISMALDGRLYRFRTAEERIQFVFGFQAAWNLIDEAYLKKTHGE